MKAFVFGLVLGLIPALFGCAAWDYTVELQNCVDNHVGDPVGREACLCAAAKDAGRSCDFIQDGGSQ